MLTTTDGRARANTLAQGSSIPRRDNMGCSFPHGPVRAWRGVCILCMDVIDCKEHVARRGAQLTGSCLLAIVPDKSNKDFALEVVESLIRRIIARITQQQHGGVSNMTGSYVTEPYPPRVFCTGSTFVSSQHPLVIRNWQPEIHTCGRECTEQ